MLRILCSLLLASMLLLPAPLTPNGADGAVVHAAPGEDREGRGNAQSSAPRQAEPTASTSSTTTSSSTTSQDDTQRRMAEVQKALEASRAQEAEQTRRSQEAAQQRAQEAQRAAEAAQRAQEAEQKRLADVQQRAQEQTQRAQDQAAQRAQEAAQQRAQEETQQRQAAQQRSMEQAQQQTRDGEQRLAEQRAAAAARLQAQQEAGQQAAAQQAAAQQAAAQQAAAQPQPAQTQQQTQQQAELRAQQRLQEQVQQLKQQQDQQRAEQLQQAQQAQQQAQQPAAQPQSRQDQNRLRQEQPQQQPAPAPPVDRSVEPAPRAATGSSPRLRQDVPSQSSAPQAAPAVNPVQSSAAPAAPVAPHDVATGQAPKAQSEVAAPGGSLGSRSGQAAVQAPQVVSAPPQNGIQALLSAATTIFQQPAPVRATAASTTTYTYPTGSTYTTPNGTTYPTTVYPAATAFDPYARVSAAVSPGFTNPYPYPFSYGPYPLPNTNPPVASQPSSGYSYANATFFNGGNPYAPSYRPEPLGNPYSPIYDPYGIGTVRDYSLPFNIGPIASGAPYDLYGSRYPYASVYINGVWYKPWEVPSQLGYGNNFYNPYASGTVQSATGSRRPLLPLLPPPGFGGTSPYAPQYNNGIWQLPYETPSAFGYSGMSPYSGTNDSGYGFPASSFPYVPGYPSNLLNGGYPFGGGYANGVNYAYGNNLPFGTNVPYGSIYNYSGAAPSGDTVQAYGNAAYGNPAAYVAALTGFGSQPGLPALPSVALRMSAPTQLPPSIFGLPAGAQIPGFGSFRVPSVNALRPPWLGLGQMRPPEFFGNQSGRPAPGSMQSRPGPILPVEVGLPNASSAATNMGMPAAVDAQSPNAVLVDPGAIFGPVPLASQADVAANADLAILPQTRVGEPSNAQLGNAFGPTFVQQAASVPQSGARADGSTAMALPEAAPFIVASMVDNLPIAALPVGPASVAAFRPAIAGSAAPGVPVVAAAAAAAPAAAVGGGSSFGPAFVSILAVLLGLGLWAFSFFGLRRR